MRAEQFDGQFIYILTMSIAKSSNQGKSEPSPTTLLHYFVLLLLNISCQFRFDDFAAAGLDVAAEPESTASSKGLYAID